MSGQTLLFLLLVLACPLMMVFMMRGGGHGSHAGHGHAGHGEEPAETMPRRASLDELRERRDDLEAQIQALEEQDGDRFTAAH